MENHIFYLIPLLFVEEEIISNTDVQVVENGRKRTRKSSFFHTKQILSSVAIISCIGISLALYSHFKKKKPADYKLEYSNFNYRPCKPASEDDSQTKFACEGDSQSKSVSGSKEQDSQSECSLNLQTYANVNPASDFHYKLGKNVVQNYEGKQWINYNTAKGLACSLGSMCHLLRIDPVWTTRFVGSNSKLSKLLNEVINYTTEARLQDLEKANWHALNILRKKCVEEETFFMDRLEIFVLLTDMYFQKNLPRPEELVRNLTFCPKSQKFTFLEEKCRPWWFVTLSYSSQSYYFDNVYVPNFSREAYTDSNVDLPPVFTHSRNSKIGIPSRQKLLYLEQAPTSFLDISPCFSKFRTFLLTMEDPSRMPASKEDFDTSTIKFPQYRAAGVSFYNACGNHFETLILLSDPKDPSIENEKWGYLNGFGDMVQILDRKEMLNIQVREKKVGLETYKMWGSITLFLKVADNADTAISEPVNFDHTRGT
eukprot:GHVP01045933.1.p1 GENE.GHVP01045933.1~~GHVP01045933.1.p1  ORF type:complete len:483 (+),score=74.03 GHVP01045933.1:21-1469(+)